MGTNFNQFFSGIFFAPIVHQKNAPANRSVVKETQNSPVRSDSVLADPLPWVSGSDHPFYTDWWVTPPTVPSKTLTLPQGSKPFSVSTSGVLITDAPFSTLQVGLALTNGGNPVIIMDSITLPAAGLNIVSATVDVPNSVNLAQTMWVVFQIVGADVILVATELSTIVRYNTA